MVCAAVALASILIVGLVASIACGSAIAAVCKICDWDAVALGRKYPPATTVLFSQDAARQWVDYAANAVAHFCQ